MPAGSATVVLSVDSSEAEAAFERLEEWMERLIEKSERLASTLQEVDIDARNA